MIGFRHWTYRKRAVEALCLLKGDTVVDLGCGTGLNFSLLQEQIGPEGKFIGVDLTDAMLVAANHRVLTYGWLNVELVQSDAARYDFPAELDGIISAFALTLVPEFDEVVRRGSEALRFGKRFVVLDFKMPSSGFMKKAAPALAKLMTGPFGGTIEMATRKPWQSLKRYLALTEFRDLAGPHSLEIGTVAHETASNATFSLRCPLSPSSGASAAPIFAAKPDVDPVASNFRDEGPTLADYGCCNFLPAFEERFCRLSRVNLPTRTKSCVPHSISTLSASGE